MTGRQDVFQQAMNQGHSAAWDQLWDHAASFYRQALGEFPNHPKALTSLGLALLRLQRYEEALVYYQRASKILPEDPLPVENLAQIYERMGRINDAVQASLRAADLYLKKNDTDRAIENWVRITRFEPDNLRSHSFLAVVYERQGRKNLAVSEYLAVAGIVQRNGDKIKAMQAVEHALQLIPESSEAQKALSLLRANQPLPRPGRSKSGTGELLLEQAREAKPGKAASATQANSQDPIIAARQRALFQLAEILFEKTEETEDEQAARKDVNQILRGTGSLSPEQTERAKIILHLGQAIDAQTQNQDVRAAEELDQAIEAGLVHPAAQFDLGLLRTRTEQPDAALRCLQQSIRHTDFALAGNLLLGQSLRKLGLLHEAAMSYLEALRIADVQSVPADQADDLRQLYDPILDAEGRELDEKVLTALCDTVAAEIVRPDWREHLLAVRQQLPAQPAGSPPMPLAEILLNTHSSQVIESIASIRNLASRGCLSTAVEEAYQALPHAPTYLPLHVQIAELFLQDNRPQEAAEKLQVVSRVHEVRGENNQAIRLLQRVVQLDPGDSAARAHLVDLMAASGDVDGAIQGSIDMADLSYRLGEMDGARKNYENALNLASKSARSREWSVKILAAIGDIDMQRLDWRQAMKSFAQIRLIQPDDEKACLNLVDLNYRLQQEASALKELDSYLSVLATTGQASRGLGSLERLVQDWPESIELRKRLAAAYQTTGRPKDAAREWNIISEQCVKKNNPAGALEALEAVLAMNPSDPTPYRSKMDEIRRSKWNM